MRRQLKYNTKFMKLEKLQQGTVNENIEKPDAQLDERESFIKRYGILSFLGAVALHATVAYQEKPAEAAEVARGMTWKEGFLVLKDDVYKSQNEQGADVVLRKDGSVMWVGSTLGEKNLVRGNVVDILKTVEKEIETKSIESFCSFHTHPVSAIEHMNIINKKESDDIMVRGATTLSIPPSVTDVNMYQSGSIKLSSAIEDAGGYVVNVVFDPSRVWRHRVAMDADAQKFPNYWREITHIRELFPRLKQHIISRLAIYTEEQLGAFKRFLPKKEQSKIESFEQSRRSGGFSTEQVVRVKQTAILMTLLVEKTPGLVAEVFKDDDAGRQLQEEWSRAYERKNKDAEGLNLNNVVFKEWIPASIQGEPGEELYKKLQEAYIRIGTVLESFTYEEVESDPFKLCRWPKSQIAK